MISNKGILPCKLISEKYLHLREHNITNNLKLLAQITSTQRARYCDVRLVDNKRNMSLAARHVLLELKYQSPMNHPRNVCLYLSIHSLTFI